MVCVDLLVDVGVIRLIKDYEWLFEDFLYLGILSDGCEYWCYGVGCVVKLLKGCIVDFDFGENGEIIGFFVFCLKRFFGFNFRRYEFSLYEEMCDCFEVLILEFVFLGYIFYYLFL